MEANENSSSADQVSRGPVPAENPTPPAAAPPAAALVTSGAVKSERELQLEGELQRTRAEAEAERRGLQTRVSELERDKQNLLVGVPPAPKPKVRRLGPIPCLVPDELSEEQLN